MLAQKDAEEQRIVVEVDRIRAAVEAEAQRLLNEAENVLTDEARLSVFRRNLLDKVEGIVRESVRPMEKIDGINILHVDGLGNAGGTGRNMTDEGHRLRAPLPRPGSAHRLPARGDIGMEGGSLARMGGLVARGARFSTVSAVPPRPTFRPRDPGAGRPGTKRRNRRAEQWPGSTSRASSAPRWGRYGSRVRDFNGLPGWHPLIGESGSRTASRRIVCRLHPRPHPPGRLHGARAASRPLRLRPSSAPTRSWNPRWGSRATWRPCG